MLNKNSSKIIEKMNNNAPSLNPKSDPSPITIVIIVILFIFLVGGSLTSPQIFGIMLGASFMGGDSPLSSELPSPSNVSSHGFQWKILLFIVFLGLFCMGVGYLIGIYTQS